MRTRRRLLRCLKTISVAAAQPTATTVSGEMEPKQQALMTTASVPRSSAEGAVVV